MELEIRVIGDRGTVIKDWSEPAAHLAQDTIEHLLCVFSRRITLDSIHLISKGTRIEVRIKYDNRKAQ